MEISKILIKNFKGIENVELGPIKPINVLIGRNNSGKSSILTCFQCLSEYFNAMEPKDATVTYRSSIGLAREYFRRGIEEDLDLAISMTVTQTTQERRRQFTSAVNTWNKNKSNISPEVIEAHIQNGLFTNTTFDFVARSPRGNLGLIAIRTECKSTAEDSIDVVLAEAQAPGGTLKCLSLNRLFSTSYRTPNKYLMLYDLEKKHGFEEGLSIDHTRGGFKSNGDPVSLENLIMPAFNYVKELVSSAFLVSPYRHSREKDLPQLSTNLRNDGSNLVQYLHNLALNKHDVFENIAVFVEKIVPEVGRLHPRFTGTTDNTLELAYDWADGRMVNLTNMGGGVEQLLILGCLLIHQRTSCILWEEPESHLHPAAQDVLLNELENRAGDSLIFLSTQSPVFIRPSGQIAVHAITNPDGKNASGRTLSEHELQEAAIIVGSRPGHLAQADIVVYVEGKTGAATVKEWLNKWPTRDQVLGYLQIEVQPLNVDEIASEEALIRSLQKVSPNLIIFVDRDNEPGKTEPKESRTKLKKKCHKLHIPCIITEKRQIEDYFTYEAVEKALPSTLSRSFKKNYDAHKSISEQLKKGWKVYNYKIAREIVWEDVEKYKEIQGLLAEIKEYAKKLRPDWSDKAD